MAEDSSLLQQLAPSFQPFIAFLVALLLRFGPRRCSQWIALTDKIDFFINFCLFFSVTGVHSTMTWSKSMLLVNLLLLIFRGKVIQLENVSNIYEYQYTQNIDWPGNTFQVLGILLVISIDIGTFA